MSKTRSFGPSSRNESAPARFVFFTYRASLLDLQHGQSSENEALGLPLLASSERQQAELGNMLLDKSVDAALAVLAGAGDFSLENPEKSLLWNMPAIQYLKIMYPTFVVSFDQCCFGSLHLKH